jgi:hypothetical protein
VISCQESGKYVLLLRPRERLRLGEPEQSVAREELQHLLLCVLLPLLRLQPEVT